MYYNGELKTKFPTNQLLTKIAKAKQKYKKTQIEIFRKGKRNQKLRKTGTRKKKKPTVLSPTFTILLHGDKKNNLV